MANRAEQTRPADALSVKTLKLSAHDNQIMLTPTGRRASGRNPLISAARANVTRNARTHDLTAKLKNPRFPKEFYYVALQ